ncbi:5-formyltetrahydrofolate cyclo-ligase [Hoeflea sp. WL0058]|uniref:5-formyltetrahydrofolate cyclo-ligase n=1 Tax=Flavimaribacter sediminis TaxID=2865987 RepID=A0AAE2ZMT6_9HYPH|nr:5-formyltetrahydrofolate cyclo-ligase [Flavimaribacter sediminis]MBW8639101.1 5-formyltetrahydrofolate cyclo-ligase [Flavimaribacter sediminis]
MTRSPSKAEIRNSALLSRDATDPESRIEASLAIAEIGAGSIDIHPGEIVSGFWPIRSEVDVRPLMFRLMEKGARLCLPVVLDRTTIIFRELVRGAPMVDTGFGTAGPGDEAEVLDPDLMLAPLAAFDATGHRIGYGAGHYDRAIARLRDRGKMPRLIGVALDVQEVETVPAEDHDIPLPAILTESGMRRFSVRD